MVSQGADEHLRLRRRRNAERSIGVHEGAQSFESACERAGAVSIRTYRLGRLSSGFNRSISAWTCSRERS